MLFSRKRIREEGTSYTPSSSKLSSVERIDWKQKENRKCVAIESKPVLLKVETQTSISNEIIPCSEDGSNLDKPLQIKSEDKDQNRDEDLKQTKKGKERIESNHVKDVIEKRKSRKFLIENEDIWKDLEMVLVSKKRGIYLLSGGCGRGKTYGIEFLLNKMNIKKLECNTENVERGVGDEMKDMIRSEDVNKSQKQVVVEDLDGWTSDQLSELKTLKTVDAPILVTCVNPYSPSLKHYRDMFDKIWKLKDVTKRSMYEYASYLSPKSDSRTLTNAVESCRGDMRQLEFSLSLHSQKDTSPLDPLDATRRLMCGKPEEVRSCFSHHESGFLLWMGWANYNPNFNLEECSQYAEFFSCQDILWKDEQCVQEMMSHLPKKKGFCDVKWNHKSFQNVKKDGKRYCEEDHFKCFKSKLCGTEKKEK